MRAFFATIPLELEEAALVDGAGRVRALIYVVLPLALPGIIATSIFTFILAGTTTSSPGSSSPQMS